MLFHVGKSIGNGRKAGEPFIFVSSFKTIASLSKPSAITAYCFKSNGAITGVRTILPSFVSVYTSAFSFVRSNSHSAFTRTAFSASFVWMTELILAAYGSASIWSFS